MLRRTTPSSATLTGGDLSVDVLHTEDSVRLGDGTDLLSFIDVSAVKCIPVDVKAVPATLSTSANQTNGTQRSKITDGTDNVEIDDVGGEKALKVSVIASVGGGGGGTAATDSAAYTATSSQFTPVGGAYDDTASDALAEGEMGMVRLTSARAMHVAVQNSVAVTGTFWQATQPVSASSLPLPTGAATETTLDAIKTSVELIDDTVKVDDAAFTPGTSKILMIGAQADETSPDSVDEGDAGALRMTLARELLVKVNVALPTGSNVIGAVTQSGTWNIGSITTLPSIPAGTNNIGDVDIASIAAGDNNIGNVDIASIAAGDNNIGNVDVVSLPAIPAGTNNIGDVDILSIAAGDNNIGNVDIVTMPNVTGAAAHDAAISGNPVPMAGRANNANPTSVAAGDSTYINTDLAGRQVVTFTDRALVTQATGSQTSTTEATILSAGGANVFLDLTLLMITNSNTTTAAQVQIRDATAGTIRMEHMIPPNSGLVINFPVPFKQTTANNNWTIDLQAAVSTVYYTVQAIQRLA